MAKYDVLFEDEDDIFGGTPSSKFWDFFTQLPQDRARETLDEFIARYATMERIIAKSINNDEVDGYIDTYQLANAEEMDTYTKSIYLELTGKIVGKMSQ